MSHVLGPPGPPPQAASTPAARAPGGPLVSIHGRDVSGVAKYRVLIGINYPVGKEEKRAEPGEAVANLPAASIPWLLEQKVIEPVKDKS